jgi:hypothetical protein
VSFDRRANNKADTHHGDCWEQFSIDYMNRVLIALNRSYIGYGSPIIIYILKSLGKKGEIGEKANTQTYDQQ